MVLIRPKPDVMNFRYLRFWLNSPALARHIHGHRDGSVAERLNLRPDAPFETVQAAISGMHGHWRRVAQNPLIDPSFTRAAQVLQRTCEGLAAAVRAAPQRPPTGQRSMPPRRPGPPPVDKTETIQKPPSGEGKTTAFQRPTNMPRGN